MDLTSIIIIAVAVMVAIAFLVLKIKKEGLRPVIIKFIVEAEKGFQYGRNTEKFNYVFERVYNYVPVYLKFFITKENVIKFIDKVFEEVKIALNYQNTNGK